MPDERVTARSENGEYWVAPGPKTNSDPYLSNVINISQYSVIEQSNDKLVLRNEVMGHSWV